MIQFLCERCGRRLGVADSLAGRRGKCPHCGHILHVPQPGAAPAESEERGSISAASPRDRMLLDLPHEALPTTGDREADVSTGEVAADVEQAGEAGVEAPAGPGDAILYPTSADGLVHIGVLVLALWGAELFKVFIAPFLGFYSGILVLVLKILIVAYIVFYLGYCMFDSSRGGRRAPSIALAPPLDRQELLSQMLLLLASTAICFWPAAIYYGVTGHLDMWGVLLTGAGGFFWPMALLAAVLFDGIDALNPLLIVRSVVVTLPAYLLLTIELAVLAALAAVVRLASSRLPVPQVLGNAVYLYLLLAGAHLLGRHYCRHRERLDWGL